MLCLPEGEPAAPSPTANGWTDVTGTPLRRTDLGLLYGLIALVEERSVTRAAERMFMSQPAMSRAFARMQALFDDVLLVRTREGYEPTQRALRLCAEIKTLLPQLEALIGNDQFDPATAETVFRVAASDYAASILLPDIMGRMTERAPNMRLEINPLSSRQFDQLDSGALDLVLWGNVVPPHLNTQVIFTDRFVSLVRRDHPISSDALTLDQYLSYPHAVIALTEHQQGVVDQVLRSKRLSRRVQLEIPYFACTAWTIEHSDAILTIPEKLARRLVRFSQTRILRPPMELPGIDYIQVWHTRVDGDPAHRWFRGLVADVAGSLPDRPATVDNTAGS